MGQKTNSKIFRLGINNNEWNSKYFEKNKEEFSKYNYQNIQIQEYLKHFFKRNNLILHSCKCYMNNNKLHIYISYYNTKKSILNITKGSDIKFQIKQKQLDIDTNYVNETLKLSRFLKIAQKNSKKNSNIKTKRLKMLKKYKRSLLQTKYNSIENLEKNKFLDQLFEGLSLFTNNKFHIHLSLQNINKGISVSFEKTEQEFLKKKLLFLKRYTKHKFFKEGINICLILSKMKHSGQLFTNFLADQIAGLKRHNLFLIFLKNVLTILITSKFSKIKGIKIIISGRFNGAPRAKNRLLVIGNIPIQTINNNIDYSESTSYTRNGTFGVKTWIN